MRPSNCLDIRPLPGEDGLAETRYEMWTAYVADRPADAAAAGFAESDCSRPGAERHAYRPILRFTPWRKPRP